MPTTRPEVPSAVLVGIRLPGHSDAEVAESLAELTRLVETLGHPTVATMVQPRPNLTGPTILGEGKLRELAELTGGSGKVAPKARPRPHKAKLRAQAEAAEVEAEAVGPSEEGREPPPEARPEGPAGSPRPGLVIFDCELSPTQMRNLESATGAEVLDRPAVIIQIFGRHARSRAAKLQVEAARLRYLAPRMRETGRSERSGGGIGAKGVGESKAELDRRRIRDRVREIEVELETVAAEDGRRRERRADGDTVALVGYTNAGKSSMMRALTGSEVLVQDKLFATLDTTVRPLQPESVPRILVTDTVGFIRNLPHALVACFRSTLEEARNASLLLVMADASDPAFRNHLEVVRETLSEVGADSLPRILVLNKADRLDPGARAGLAAADPEAEILSVFVPGDVARLSERIRRHFERDMVERQVFVPFASQGAVGRVRAAVRVIAEAYGAEGVTFTVRTSPDNLARLTAVPEDGVRVLPA